MIIEGNPVELAVDRPQRVVACTSCGTVFDVEGEYHYTWWKWVRRG